MLTIFIVLPILMILMFTLGLTLELDDFYRLKERPRDIILGLGGQLLMLPAIAIVIALLFAPNAVFFVGLVLIACCPGGSSSNIFSMLARGDVALSVSLTALSSVLTLITMPVILALAMTLTGVGADIDLPVMSLLMQNLVTMLLPVAAGLLLRRLRPAFAARLSAVLSRFAFPALITLAGIFFVQNRAEIADHIGTLGLSVTALLLLSVVGAALLAKIFHTGTAVRRTLVIEIGMQNAAQAIALASSPLVFNNSLMAMPAIIYALMMNVVLLAYIAPLQWHRPAAAGGTVR